MKNIAHEGGRMYSQSQASVHNTAGGWSRTARVCSHSATASSFFLFTVFTGCVQISELIYRLYVFSYIAEARHVWSRPRDWTRR